MLGAGPRGGTELRPGAARSTRCGARTSATRASAHGRAVTVRAPARCAPGALARACARSEPLLLRCVPQLRRVPTEGVVSRFLERWSHFRKEGSRILGLMRCRGWVPILRAFVERQWVTELRLRAAVIRVAPEAP